MLILLHTIQSSGKTVKGKTRLQKLIFLAQKKFGGSFDYQFKPAPFGPLSFKLNHAIHRAKKMGLLNESINKTPSGNEVYSFDLTDDGEELLEFGVRSSTLSEDIRKSIGNSVNEYGNLDFTDLLDYVHTEFPDFQEEY